MEFKPIKYAGRYQLKHRGTQCLNCGHPLSVSDRYCPGCAQANSTKKLTIRDFIEEFFASLIDYDSRFLKTIKTLLWRPGRITLDFVAGKRMRYTNPFRFLLSLAFIYFLLVSLSGDFSNLDRYNLDEQTREVPDVPLSFELDTNNPEEAKALRKLDSLGLSSGDTLSFGKGINAAIRRKDSLIKADPKAYFQEMEGGYLGRVIKKSEAFLTLFRKDTLYTFEEAVERYGFEDSGENRTSFSTARSLKRAMERPGTFLQDLFERLPFATFFFLPVFAVFIWLVYIRKSYTYTDNLVFSFHIQSLFFILLIIGYIVNSLIGWDIYWLCFTGFATYLFIAMRRFYKQGVFKTIIKYLFLNTIFVILAVVAAVAVLLGSAVTY